MSKNISKSDTEHAVMGKHEVCSEIVRVFGLEPEDCFKLTLHMSCNSVVSINVGIRPKQAELEKLAPIFKRFVLLERDVP